MMCAAPHEEGAPLFLSALFHYFRCGAWGAAMQGGGGPSAPRPPCACAPSSIDTKPPLPPGGKRGGEQQSGRRRCKAGEASPGLNLGIRIPALQRIPRFAASPT